ncbi:MAG TPA: alpha/beta hydrolase [Phycisphaerae bacterium]|nr:alpha/beta hydrolase [Phycisphaerae bacterium]
MTLKPTRRLVLLLVLALAPVVARAGEPVSFEITFSKKLRTEPFTGRVIIYMSDKLSGQPRLQHGWTSRQPVFGKNVKDWKPESKLTITEADGFPYSLAELPAKKYAVQAVMHTNLDEPHSGKAPGNLYSKSEEFDLDAADFDGVITLRINKRVAEKTNDSGMPRSKIVELKSEMLSKFYGRDVYQRAVVLLPREYESEPDRKFPAIYVIHGFGGDHFQSAMMASIYGKPNVPVIRIGLDASCALGHHVFADSANNGPRGTALVEELIPYLEKEFRLISDPRARLLTGHSSGGWASLWLQVAYPDYFGGVWSTSPDPVTFHDFCGPDFYEAGANAYYKDDDSQWPTMRENGAVKQYLKEFVEMEETIGPGGQIQSFDAVFSPQGDDGMPLPAFDRKTGKVNPDVIKAWKKYDIVEKLKKEWPTLKDKLEGKITVIMGGEDTFYLEGAARIMQKEMKKLGSTARIIIVPGRDHGSIMGSKPFRNMYPEMCEHFKKCGFAPTSQPADED